MSAEAERWRKARSLTTPHNTLITPGDALAAALEAERERTAEFEAGLRRIAELDGIYDVDPGALLSQAERIARDLLAGRAAAGEG